ncbi:hypothetical protein AYK26_07650 [Euryarchaeota archaeon SM23-78]|nr:MAG: hypothetical protein AYK26_07650 [Euryarchaeota archaeon SM23-78]
MLTEVNKTFSKQRQKKLLRMAIKAVQVYRHRYSFNANLYKMKVASGMRFEKDAKDWDDLSDAMILLEMIRNGLG